LIFVKQSSALGTINFNCTVYRHFKVLKLDVGPI
jgi:hypothetical protein